VNLRYIAMCKYGSRYAPASSYKGADSLYTAPGQARRYAGKDGKVLVVDLDKLPEIAP
jgi:hypothetical protein